LDTRLKKQLCLILILKKVRISKALIKNISNVKDVVTLQLLETLTVRFVQRMALK